MKVKMNNTETGQYPGMRKHTGMDNDGYHCLVGHEYDIPDALGKAWVSKGIAKKVKTATTKATAKKEKKDGN